MDTPSLIDLIKTQPYQEQILWAMRSPIHPYLITKTITREEMKRKLASDQFRDRLTPPRQDELVTMLEDYTHAVDRGNDSKVLLTEIPLRLTETLNRKGDPELEAIVLVGYRIYKVKRSNPENPELLCIYSKLTRKWHRVGYSDSLSGVLGGRSIYTYDGCYSLGDGPWSKTPQPVADGVVRRCLLVDKASDHGIGRYALHWAVRGDGYHLWSLCGVCDQELEATPRHLLLLRFLRSKPEAYTAMLALVDQYGMPDGLLGEVFQHADKFRTV